MNASRRGNLIRDAGIIVFSILVAALLARTGMVELFLAATRPSRLLASFAAGIFFTSIFTAAPATVMLVELAQSGSVFLVSLAGAFGALAGDYVIFRFVRDSVAEDFQQLIKRGTRQRWLSIFHLKLFRWLIPLLGAIVIASPLPDEIGLTMLGLSHMKRSYFFAVSFFLNFLGILFISLLMKNLL